MATTSDQPVPEPIGLLPRLGGTLHSIGWRAVRTLTGATDIPVLNGSPAEPPPDQPEGALFQIARQVRAAAIGPAGRRVDYATLAQSDSYRELRSLTAALSICRLQDLGDSHDRLAFWINLYNVLVLDAIIHFRVEERVGQSLFQKAAYDVCGHRFSADDIEHGVLRKNRPHPAYRLRPFGRGDPRRAAMLPRLDPRIHFALNCGARSCPPIAFYRGPQIGEQLATATATFIAGGGVQIDPAAKTLSLSRIFLWYQSDFGGREGLLELIADHLKDEEGAALVRSGQLRVRYQPYDWSVNRLF